MGRVGPSAPLSTGTTWPANHRSWWGRYSCKCQEHLEANTDAVNSTQLHSALLIASNLYTNLHYTSRTLSQTDYFKAKCPGIYIIIDPLLKAHHLQNIKHIEYRLG